MTSPRARVTKPNFSRRLLARSLARFLPPSFPFPFLPRVVSSPPNKSNPKPAASPPRESSSSPPGCLPPLLSLRPVALRWIPLPGRSLTRERQTSERGLRCWYCCAGYAEPDRVPWHLRYPSGAPSVCCALCQAITTVPPLAPVLEMAHLICGGCRTLLMYSHNADTVRCSCCSTVNLVRPVNNIAHVSCGQCRTTLMYPYGAPSVKCAICHYITNTGVNTMAPTPSPMPTSSGSSYNALSTSVSTSRPQNVIVVVENPMTVDEKGKLVSNVVVGVTTGK